MSYAGLMVGYQHQVGSRTAKMLTFPALLFQAAPMQTKGTFDPQHDKIPNDNLLIKHLFYIFV